MNEPLSTSRRLWLSVRSNPIFVVVSSAVAGAVLDAAQDELATGHLDFSRAGIHKLGALAFTAAITGLIHLYRPSPKSNPNPNH